MLRQALESPIVKVNSEKGLIFGWGYQSIAKNGTAVIDVSGDIVDDPDELEDAAYDFVQNSRRGDRMHKGEPVATLIESVVVTPEKARALGIEHNMPTGWWIGMKVHDPDVLQEIREGKLRSFSVGGRGFRTQLGTP